MSTQLTAAEILDRARAIHEQIRGWRREIHRHPELTFTEQRTAGLVNAALVDLGIATETEVAKTGVVGHIRGGDGPLVGLRADMDALPIQEVNGTEFDSTRPGIMHACGHDAHTAILLGVATMLATMEDRPPGQVRFFFQPSEEASDSENKSGATRMIEDGALKGVDAVIALHVASDLEAGKVEIGDGYVSANEDSFEIWLRGTGGHGAMPHQTVDPVFILGPVLAAIQGIRARRVDPTKAAAISIGILRAGAASNVIPAEVYISGTMRSFDDATRAQLKDELAQALTVARALGGDFVLKIKPGYPSMYNDPAVAAVIRSSTTALAGAEILEPAIPQMGAEDFAYMSRQAPGAMFMLGARIGEDKRPHHTPVFDIDEAVLPLGAAVLADAACALLREKAR